MSSRHISGIGVLILAAAVAGQQRPPSPEPAFDVASIKPTANDAAEGISVQPDGVRFSGFHVRTLMTIAYRTEGIQRFDQLVGGPKWIAAERFDISAKSTGGPAALPAMLRTLLRERFRLRAHTEKRSMPAFALRLARGDGRLGPQIRESTIDCGDAPAGHPGSENRCGIRADGGVITGRSVSSAQLAGNLSGYPTIDRFVADRTGLSGRYDFRLEYSPAFVGPDAVANPGPSLFTALTEQLGLTLQPEKALLPVLVIDRVEKPTRD